VGRRGFSLIEAAAAVAIAALILGLAGGSLLSLGPKYRLEGAVWEVRAALTGARTMALRDGVSYRVRFLEAGISTERYDPARGDWILSRRSAPEGVRITANNVPVFTALGGVTGLATITAANGWGAAKLTLAITGRIKVVRIS
jgi:prepilin-type N-terminal cleavage/methylation domain-containing protein